MIAALAAPQQGAPSDEDLLALADGHRNDHGLIDLHSARDYARAVLARYGGQAAPVPVAERSVLLAAGVRSGYMRGHEDTVEGCYGDPDEVAADLVPQLLSEADWALPLPEAQP